MRNTFGSNAKKLAGCGYTVEEVVAAGIGRQNVLRPEPRRV
ncbi:MAG: hypothetical protein ACLR7U_09945 [Ruthenibacterium lactatiformans]